MTKTPGKKTPQHISTKALHAAEEIDPVTGATTPSIVPAASFVPPKGNKIFSAYEYSTDMGYSYSRWASPTVGLLEKKMAALENGEDAVVFASGMAAATGLFIYKLKAGDHMALGNVGYPGIAEFAHHTLMKFGVNVTFFDPSDLGEAAAAIRPDTKLVFIDTPANPILRLADISAIAEITHANGAELVIDSTFATPVATQPLALGADYVMHSLTKFLNGHGDALGGVVVGKKSDMADLRTESLIHLGSNLGAFEAWLVLRGIQTLWPRMVMHQDNAMRVARFLEGHPQVTRVNYPGLTSHPQHDLAKRQMKNFGGVLAFCLKGGAKSAARVLEKLEVIENAVSLGKTKSLIYFIATDELQKNSFKLNKKELAKYMDWAGEGVIRFSVGLESPEDLIADLDQAMKVLEQ